VLSRRPILPRLPAKTLALTYDDGPGPHSVEIGEFLHSKGIRATFFVVGKHVRQYPGAVEKLAELGHVVGNHTDQHTDLLTIKETPARLVAEVLEADRLIAGFAGGGTRFFRPPRGRWSPDVADELNRHEELAAYAGPIHWNIDAADWQIGLRRGSPPADEIYTVEQCAKAYLETVVAKDSGVVLLHDWLADSGKLGDYLREKNRTLELTRLLIPQLSGFRFIGLDQMEIAQKS
jgi:peptidoglycan/xylan/chitin deacetylase (PgdA/CDA1 family)